MKQVHEMGHISDGSLDGISFFLVSTDGQTKRNVKSNDVSKTNCLPQVRSQFSWTPMYISLKRECASGIVRAQFVAKNRWVG